jgi:undecaprenyl-diphosphatase
MMNTLEDLNHSLFLHINAGPGTPSWLIILGVGAADYLIYLIPALLAWMWLWGDGKRRSLALQACLVVLVGVGANLVIGMIHPHPRPFMVGLGHTWISHAADPSFPSDHMTVFMGLGLSLVFGRAIGLGAGVVVVGLAVAWARIFLGVGDDTVWSASATTTPVHGVALNRADS